MFFSISRLLRAVPKKSDERRLKNASWKRLQPQTAEIYLPIAFAIQIICAGFELYNDNRILVRRKDTETYRSLPGKNLDDYCIYIHRQTNRVTLLAL